MKFQAILRFHGAEPGKRISRNGPSASALCLSGLLHGTLIVAAFLGSSYFPQQTTETVDIRLIVPDEKKIIWYPLKEAPAIAPTQRIGTAPVPQGEEKRARAIVRDDPEAKTGKQFLWRPDSARKIEQDIPAPNMIAVEAPPSPAKPRNVFHLPEPAPAIQRPAEAVPAPPVPATALAPKPAQATPELLAAIPKVTRAFVAPPQAVRRKLDLKPDDSGEPPPIPAGVFRPVGDASNGALAEVLGNGPAPARRKFVPPPASKGTGAAGASVKLAEIDAPPVGEGVNAAVLSTSPLDKLLTAIPEGSRPVRMSAAPVQGAPSSGPVKSASGLRLPGVAVAGAPTPESTVASGPKPPRPTRTVYEETRNAVLRSSLSAPLRPSSRIVPALIESHFHDRVAYSMIISKPQLPVYAGNWVLWFAEKLPRAGSPQMRAPQPIRKVEAVDAQPAPGLGGRVQLAATILKNGQVDSVVVLNGANDGLTQAAAIRDIQSWQFAPALRDGEAVDVDVILEILFQASAAPISTGSSRH